MQVQRQFCGDIQLTFHRSFSYPHYKALFHYSQSQAAPQHGSERLRRSRNSRMIADRTECFIHGVENPLGHTLVFGICCWSRLRLEPVTQYVMIGIPCKDYPNNLVEMVMDRGINTEKCTRRLRLAPASHTRSHDVSYRYTAMTGHRVEEQRDEMQHEDLYEQSH
jgi:hypothetical protein